MIWDAPEPGASPSPPRRLIARGVVLYPADAPASFHGIIPAHVIGAEALCRGWGRVFAGGMALDLPVLVAAGLARSLDSPFEDDEVRPTAVQN